MAGLYRPLDVIFNQLVHGNDNWDLANFTISSLVVKQRLGVFFTHTNVDDDLALKVDSNSR